MTIGDFSSESQHIIRVERIYKILFLLLPNLAFKTIALIGHKKSQISLSKEFSPSNEACDSVRVG